MLMATVPVLQRGLEQTMQIRKAKREHCVQACVYLSASSNEAQHGSLSTGSFAMCEKKTAFA